MSEFSLKAIEKIGAEIVGRRNEIEVIVAALAANRHVMLEGPPGTGKSSLLRALAEASNAPLVFVEGNAELTPARLIGSFDPARVLTEGYSAEVFLKVRSPKRYKPVAFSISKKSIAFPKKLSM